MRPIRPDDYDIPPAPPDAGEPDRQTELDEASPQIDAGCGPVDLAGVPVMYMTSSAYQETMQFLTSSEHGDNEAGGILIGPRGDDDLITHFVPDRDARTTVASYAPNVVWLNKTLKQYVACDMNCKGLAHKHPPGCTRPSYGDLLHVNSTFGRAKNSGALQFFMPIVCDGHLYPYIITRAEPDRVQLAKLVII